MTEIEQAGRWLLILLALGWLTTPLAWRLFPALPDRGLMLARPLGLLFVAYLAWLAASLHLLPFERAIWLISIPALLIASLISLLWQRLRRTMLATTPVSSARIWSGRWLLYGLHEALFIASFAGFAWLRGFVPDITFTEKPMELMLLNSVLRGGFMPPSDSWLAGFSVNYYYLGYVLAAALTLVASVPVGVAFNLMLTTIVALAAALAFGLGASLWATQHESESRLGLGAIVTGLLAAYLLVLAGNLFAGLRWLRDPMGTTSADWWSAVGWPSSRVVIDWIGGAERETINEFPWFSFLLGDLHPHILALPFGMLALGIALDWWLRSPLPGLIRRAHGDWARLLAGAIAVGSLYALNSWDYPLYLLLTIIALTRPVWSAPARQRHAWRTAGLVTLGFAGLSVLLLAPFYMTFTSFAGSDRLPPAIASLPLIGALARLIGVVTWSRTDLGEFLQVFGFFLAACAAWLAVKFQRGPRLFPRLLALGIIGALLAGTLFGSAPLALAGALLVTSLVLWRYGKLTAGDQFVCLLLLAGFGLPVVAEFVFLQDAFADRMNTVFKAYFQSWLLLSLVGAVGLVSTARGLIRLWRSGATLGRGALAGAGVVVLLAALAITTGYPLIATGQRANGFHERAGLDGLAYLNRLPDEQAALIWVRQLPPGTVVAEEPGRSYGEYFGLPYARVSTIAGSLAPLGWSGHEQQWRGGQPAARAQVTQRYGDIQMLYSTTDINQAQQLIARYGIEYVYVGAIERDADARARANLPVYTPEALAKFNQFMDVAFEDGRVTIYRRRA